MTRNFRWAPNIGFGKVRSMLGSIIKKKELVFTKLLHAQLVGVTGFEPATTRPQTRTLTGLSYTPNCGCKGTVFLYLQIFSVLFYIKSASFMQGIDETNKSIPYIQRETYWCVF